MTNRTSQSSKAEDGSNTGTPQEQAVEVLLEQRILRVDGDGTGHVTSISTPQIPGGEKMRTVVYQQLGGRGDTLQASSPHQGNAFSFPEEPVEVGSTWTGTTQTQLPNVPNPITMNYGYKVEGEEALGARHCIKISFSSDEVKFSVPLPDGSGVTQVTTRTEGLMHFDPNDGCLAKLDLTSWTTPRMGKVAFEVVNRSEQVLL